MTPSGIAAVIILSFRWRFDTCWGMIDFSERSPKLVSSFKRGKLLGCTRFLLTVFLISDREGTLSATPMRMSSRFVRPSSCMRFLGADFRYSMALSYSSASISALSRRSISPLCPDIKLSLIDCSTRGENMCTPASSSVKYLLLCEILYVRAPWRYFSEPCLSLACSSTGGMLSYLWRF